jgi:hypothetical protein
MRSEANTVNDYLKTLPEDRRKAIAAVRKVILKNLPAKLEETMNWGMICYQVPLKIYPDTYNKQPLMFAALGSQKNYMVIHLMGIYPGGAQRKKFEAAYKASGKKFDAGKGCVRFKTLDDLPLDLIGKVFSSVTLEEYISFFEKAQAARKTARDNKKR